MKKIALIVAGGKGVRMKNRIPKQFLLINNLPIVMHTIKLFSKWDEIILVIPEEYIDYWNKLCKKYIFKKNITLITGGQNRFNSVKNGLNSINENCIIAIHDAVRPFTSKKILKNLIENIGSNKGSIPVLPIKDSLRKKSKNSSKAINRDLFLKVQTPQCFFSDDIKNAYNKQRHRKKFTDDASVFEANGGEIITIQGEEKNIKITTKKDMKISELLN
jgi:2-C-methyl-D-erythritol 4-phosphate cytidylyltransferase